MFLDFSEQVGRVKMHAHDSVRKEIGQNEIILISSNRLQYEGTLIRQKRPLGKGFCG